MIMAKAIMIQGTASGVGKTILTLALCRIFAQDGCRVAPFKAQNMTQNTYTAKNGDEIATSQWLQALAAGIEPTSDISPVILKPSSEGTDIVVDGKPYGKVNIDNYRQMKKDLANIVSDSYNRLSSEYDIIVIEGAGSPVELNLKQNDIVNMGMAKMAKAPVLLVSDIDRGGAFAALFGTINLLDEEECGYVKATIVNRFRGDVSGFKDGVKILENITGLPVAGVIPFTHINLPEEDDLGGSKIVKPSTNFNQEFDQIAENVRKSLDIKLVYEILNNGVEQ